MRRFVNLRRKHATHEDMPDELFAAMACCTPYVETRTKSFHHRQQGLIHGILQRWARLVGAYLSRQVLIFQEGDLLRFRRAFDFGMSQKGHRAFHHVLPYLNHDCCESSRSAANG